GNGVRAKTRRREGIDVRAEAQRRGESSVSRLLRRSRFVDSLRLRRFYTETRTLCASAPLREPLLPSVRGERSLMARMNMIQAINSALDVLMDRDADIVVMGEDVGYFGGVFRATAGLQAK